MHDTIEDIIILPGIGGSGPAHWQSLWERADPRMRRFAPADWDRPERADWIAALEVAVAASRTPPLLVAHSLACLLVAHWQAASSRAIAGAFLVAVPDPAAPAFPIEAASFAGAPAARFGFRSLVVASSNDPFGTLNYVRGRAGAWGSELVEVGAYGHLNAGSGLGAWPQGRALLDGFAASARLAPPLPA